MPWPPSSNNNNNNNPSATTNIANNPSAPAVTAGGRFHGGSGITSHSERGGSGPSSGFANSMSQPRHPPASFSEEGEIGEEEGEIVVAGPGTGGGGSSDGSSLMAPPTSGGGGPPLPLRMQSMGGTGPTSGTPSLPISAGGGGGAPPIPGPYRGRRHSSTVVPNWSSNPPHPRGRGGSFRGGPGGGMGRGHRHGSFNGPPATAGSGTSNINTTTANTSNTMPNAANATGGGTLSSSASGAAVPTIASITQPPPPNRNLPQFFKGGRGPGAMHSLGGPGPATAGGVVVSSSMPASTGVGTSSGTSSSGPNVTGSLLSRSSAAPPPNSNSGGPGVSALTGMNSTTMGRPTDPRFREMSGSSTHPLSRSQSLSDAKTVLVTTSYSSLAEPLEDFPTRSRSDDNPQHRDMGSGGKELPRKDPLLSPWSGSGSGNVGGPGMGDNETGSYRPLASSTATASSSSTTTTTPVTSRADSYSRIADMSELPHYRDMYRSEKQSFRSFGTDTNNSTTNSSNGGAGDGSGSGAFHQSPGMAQAGGRVYRGSGDSAMETSFPHSSFRPNRRVSDFRAPDTRNEPYYPRGGETGWNSGMTDAPAPSPMFRADSDTLPRGPGNHDIPSSHGPSRSNTMDDHGPQPPLPPHGQFRGSSIHEPSAPSFRTGSEDGNTYFRMGDANTSSSLQGFTNDSKPPFRSPSTEGSAPHYRGPHMDVQQPSSRSESAGSTKYSETGSIEPTIPVPFRGPGDAEGGNSNLRHDGPPPLFRGSSTVDPPQFRSEHSSSSAFRGPLLEANTPANRNDSNAPGSFFRGSGNDRNSQPPFRSETSGPNSAFRVPPSDSNTPFRGSGSDSNQHYRADNNPPFRDHYGPVGSPDFRRSPSQRGRPIYGGPGRGGPPPMQPFGTRATTFPLTGGFNARRHDPRFAEPATESSSTTTLPLPVPPDDKNNSASNAIMSAVSGDGNAGKSTFGHNPPTGSGSDAESSSERAFRSSPPRKVAPILQLFQPKPGDKPLPPLLGGAPPPSSAAIEVLEDPRLFTDALGSDNVDRAERVVAMLSVLMDNTSLKATDTDQLSELPSKQLILRAIAKMDLQLKKSQKEIEEKQESLSAEIVREQEERAVALQKAISDFRRQCDEELQDLDLLFQKEELILDEELSKMTVQRNGDEHLANGKSSLEFEGLVLQRKESERAHVSQDLEAQLTLAESSFDKDLSKALQDVETAADLIAKAKAKLSNLESTFNEKRRAAEIEQHVAAQTPDIVAAVISENRRRAAEAHYSTFEAADEDQDYISPFEDLYEVTDPKDGLTIADWALKSQQVTGVVDALYHEPSEAPYYHHNVKTHQIIQSLVKEYIRDKQEKLKRQWTELAEEYEFRRIAYKAKRKSLVKKGKKHSAAPARNSVIVARQVIPILESAGAGRRSANPYRRPRSGNEVRSEYEQEQIMAEIAAKEAMEKRIAFGGCQVPRQVGVLEKRETASYRNTFTSQKVDPVAVEGLSAITNIWTDTEKCIFLDRFLQHPKDFRKIASFLRNKTTQDCVAFYYDSKQTTPFKGALKEHIMRRKRRGDYHVWDATIQAALSVGAVIVAGPSEEKPLLFLLPEHDCTYHTRGFHPMKRELFDTMIVDEIAAEAAVVADDGDSAEPKGGRPKKRKPVALFQLDPEQRKFLRSDSPEPSPEVPLHKSLSRSTVEESASSTNGGEKEIEAPLTPSRKIPNKWTVAEKQLFVETLDKHGRNWAILSQVLSNKSSSQIKNYYYDYKKAGKVRLVKQSKHDNDVPDQSSETPSRPTVSSTTDVAKREDRDQQLSAHALSVMSSSNQSAVIDRERVSEEEPDPPKKRQKIADVGKQSEIADMPSSSAQRQQDPPPYSQQISFPQLSSQSPTTLQRQQQLMNVASSDLQASDAIERISALRRMDVDRGSRSASGSSTPDTVNATELLAQAQHHLLRHQSSSQTTEEAARRLLQHHSHLQHQQILANLYPWLASGRMPQQYGGPGSSDWSESQQYQNLLQLQQHENQSRQQQHASQHRAGDLDMQSPSQQGRSSNPHPVYVNVRDPAPTHASMLSPLTLSSIPSGWSTYAGQPVEQRHHQQPFPQQQQQQQQQHHHHHQAPSAALQDSQLALAQRLLSFRQQQQMNADHSEALHLLARGFPDRRNNGRDNFMGGQPDR